MERDNPTHDLTADTADDLGTGPDEDGPTAADLAAIEAEWPLIAAELELTKAEIDLLTAQPHPTDLDWRRLRRAEAQVMREVLALAAHVPLSDLAA
jgi:hypothetical protein